METGLSVIIPTYDRDKLFYGCLRAVLDALKDIRAEIIVINDFKKGAPDISGFGASDRLVMYNNPKSGVASARNFGAQMAKGEWLLFLDDDMLINRKNIDAYLNYKIKSGKICVNLEWEYPPDVIQKISATAFGRFLTRYGFTSMRGWNNYPDWPENTSVPVDFITSPNLFVKRAHFLETGGYDENFPFAGFEDYAFSEKLKKLGFSFYIDTTSMMYHNEADRLEPADWYKRKERGGKTRRVAVERGLKELEIKHSLEKKTFYFFWPLIEPLLKLILFLTSAFRFLDRFSFLAYKMRLGIAIYKGYTR